LARSAASPKIALQQFLRRLAADPLGMVGSPLLPVTFFSVCVRASVTWLSVSLLYLTTHLFRLPLFVFLYHMNAKSFVYIVCMMHSNSNAYSRIQSFQPQQHMDSPDSQCGRDLKKKNNIPAPNRLLTKSSKHAHSPSKVQTKGLLPKFSSARA